MDIKRKTSKWVPRTGRVIVNTTEQHTPLRGLPKLALNNLRLKKKRVRRIKAKARLTVSPLDTMTWCLWHSKQLDKLRQRHQGVCGPCLNRVPRRCDRRWDTPHCQFNKIASGMSQVFMSGLHLTMSRRQWNRCHCSSPPGLGSGIPALHQSHWLKQHTQKELEPLHSLWRGDAGEGSPSGCDYSPFKAGA